MAAQTGPQTSLLQKILSYFELAAQLGMLIPNAHVDAISLLIETLAQDLSATMSPLNTPHAALQAAAQKAQIKATVAAQNPGTPMQQADTAGKKQALQVVKSTF